MGRLGSTLAAAASIVMLLSGCIASPFSRPPVPCQPAPLLVEPSTVGAGEVIQLSAAAVDCDLGFGDGHTYTVLIGTNGTTEPIILDSAIAVGRDGAFSVALTVPETTPSGEWTLVVNGAILECNDTIEMRVFAAPPLAACAGYTSPITVTAAPRG